jgi:nitrogen fixation/metabolism regulation signal transduction histidine kinase
LHFTEKGKGKSFEKLYGTLNRINQQFKNLSSEKEAQYLYLETLVEHITLGILSFNTKGEIHLMNEAMKQLLGRPHFKNVKSIEKIDPDLLNTILEIKPSETKLIKAIIHSRLLQLSVHCSQFKIHDEEFKLISLQNIKNELEAQELDAWQKLIRVLTHEIMNSVTPITSLTSTLQGIMEKESRQGNATNELHGKLLQGLDAIKSRSEGLQKFTETYRSLTKVPVPKISKVGMNDLLSRTLTLMQSKFDENKITVHKFLRDQNSIIYADPELLQQVLINILQNAVEALDGKPDGKIRILVAPTSEGRMQITIQDNGPGIAEDKIDKIFIPFFTTKRSGSGIGLALSRQILQLHNASISVESEIDVGTSFQIVI